ncbi:MAG: glycoside hydrolase family 27 protein [Pirellulales bacterium]
MNPFPFAFLLIAAFACPAFGQNEKSTSGAKFLTWAATPPMGWNSWDCYGPTVTEAEVRANADYMAEHLKQHGWQYVVVDIRWYVENDKPGGYNQRDPRFTMDEYGRYTPAVNRFPSAEGGKGFRPLADYIHTKGLKFGIHLMRGIPVKAVNENTPIVGSDAKASDIFSRRAQCPWLRDNYTIEADRPGAQAYYDSVMKLYAAWGIDYIKIDDLSRPYHTGEIELIRKAIDAAGRPIVLSMSPGATPLNEAEHAKSHANLWRISDDFWDNWAALYEQFERCRNWAPHTAPGHWPDADMLPFGRILRPERGPARMSGFTQDEQVTVMTLWSMFRSPLMFGGDLPSNDEFTLKLISNDEVLAVNQHSTGGRELFNRDGLVAWVADVPDSRDKYLALFNPGNPPQRGRRGRRGQPAVGEASAAAAETKEVRATFADIGVTSPCSVRDLWAQRDLGDFTDGFAAPIRPHGAGLYRLTPK